VGSSQEPGTEGNLHHDAFAAACLGLAARCTSHSCSQLDMLEIWIVLDGFGLSGVGLDWIGC
jgi:hypothetical protein